MFVLIELELNYDYIENVKCIGPFTSEELAVNCGLDRIEKMKEKDASRLKFFEDYVDSIEIPELNRGEFLPFVKKYGLNENDNVTKQNFKTKLLKNMLNGYYNPHYGEAFVDFHPPEPVYYPQHYIVEVEKD